MPEPLVPESRGPAFTGLRIVPEISTESQVLAALSSTGAGFEGAGGSAHMLTEAVENGVDSIIEARRLGIPTIGVVRVDVDTVAETVSVTDDGAGFLDPIHIAKKPFDSLKKYDPNLTGKFARGIQGFRAFCNKLVFLTRRADLRPDEPEIPGSQGTGKCVRIEFDSAVPDVELSRINDQQFVERTGQETGAVAMYSGWKHGEFKRLRLDILQKRLQHHFGELVRGGGIRIEVSAGSVHYEIQPSDFSTFEPLDLEPIEVVGASGKMLGHVIPELYLTQHRKRDQWMLPFLMHRNRPVGDRPICELEEFSDAVSWGSPYITGFVRCDFCEINELRLALKAGYERDALYEKLVAMDAILTDRLRRHSKTLFDTRMRSQINQLVTDLQEFLKRKGIFDFKHVRSLGNLGSGETLGQILPAGTGPAGEVLHTPGDAGTMFVPVSVSPDAVTTSLDGEGDAMTTQTEVGGIGRGGGTELQGGPSLPGSADAAETGDAGFTTTPDALRKMGENPAEVSDGSTDSAGRARRGRRRGPRGFQLVLQDDEFNEDLSWFDPSTSTIVINSGHERYRRREGEELAKVKALMDYLAELYIWEISKIKARQESKPPEEAQDVFLKAKFEFFEERLAS